MKCFSNINRIADCWNRFGIEYIIWDVFMYFCFLSLFLMQPTTVSFWTTKLATHKKKKLDPRNTHVKTFWTHEISTKKNFGLTKYPGKKNLNPRNTYEGPSWWNPSSRGEEAYLTKRVCPVRQQREFIGATQVRSIKTNRFSLCLCQGPDSKWKNLD